MYGSDMTLRSHHSYDVRKAMGIAVAQHSGQVRWYTDEPYVNHVERVALTVMRSQEYRDNELAIVAGILHDAVEDTDFTVADAARHFPELTELPAILTLLTHVEGDDYHDVYLAALMTHPVAMIIKRADLADNLATLPFTSTKLWDKYIRALDILSS